MNSCFQLIESLISENNAHKSQINANLLSIEKEAVLKYFVASCTLNSAVLA